MRRDVARHAGTGRVGRHEDADLRGQVLVDLVQVDLDVLAGQAGQAAHDDALTQGGGGLVDDRLHGGAVELGGQQRVGVAAPESTAAARTRSASEMKFWLLATKSVSELTSTSTPV